MRVNKFLELLESDDMKRLTVTEWLRSKIQDNMDKNIEDLNTDEIYTGERCVDHGLVVGYELSNRDMQSLVDLGMVASWSVNSKRDVTPEDIHKLDSACKEDILGSFEPINRLEAVISS
jgi:hypothetical protein